MKNNAVILVFTICLGVIAFTGCSKNNSEKSLKVEQIKTDVSKISSDMKEDERQAWNMSRPGINTKERLLPEVNSEPKIKENTHVVIHFTSNAYNNQQNPYNIHDTYSIFEENKVSSNYVIDRNGEIYLFVPENRVAYHAGKGRLQDYPKYENKLNHYSVGIELLGIGTKEEMVPMIGLEKFNLINPELLGFTDAQYDALNLLLDDILTRNPKIKKDRKHIIGHDEYNPNKTDPGSLFDWSRIGL